MKSAFLILVLSIMLFSCSKEPIDKEDFLTTGTWKLTGHVRDYDEDGIYEEDTYAIFDSCIIDNIFTFQADGHAITDEGPNKCYPDHPQTTTSPWSFSDHQNRFQFEGTDFQIEELNAVTFRLRARVPYNVIFTMEVKSTYTR